MFSDDALPSTGFQISYKQRTPEEVANRSIVEGVGIVQYIVDDVRDANLVGL